MIRNTVDTGIEPDGTLYEIIEVADPKDPFLCRSKFYLCWPPDKNVLQIAELPAGHAEEQFELATGITTQNVAGWEYGWGTG